MREMIAIGSSRTLGVLASGLVCVSWIGAAGRAQATDLAELVDPEAKVVKLVGDCRFTEGPAWSPEGYLLFSDIPNNRILKVLPDGTSSVFLEGSEGANGLMFDREGRLYACQGGARQLSRIDPATKAITVLADALGGERLNSPNDLALDDDGGIWFTDPRYRRPSPDDPPVQAVYYIDAAGKLSRVIDDLGRPNGILVSPDGERLYVAQIDARTIWRYDIVGPGKLGARKKVFVGDAELDGGGPDGMAHDRHGNIWATYKKIVVVSPEGELVGRIEVPEKPANCTFGGTDGKTLYITARSSLYAIETRVEAAPLRSMRKPRVAGWSGATREVKAGVVTLKLPEAWKSEEPSNRFRLAQLSVPPLGDDEGAGECVVFWFGQDQGGSAAANVRRWIDQFDAAGRTTAVREGKAGERRYTLVDVSGAYNQPVGPPIRRQTQKVPGQRMLAVVLETKNGSYFIKLTGPKATVSAYSDAFRASFGGSEKGEKEVSVPGD